MFGYEHEERQKKLRDILKKLNVTWSDGGECLKTCHEIEALFNVYQDRHKTHQNAILTEIADIVANGVANNNFDADSPAVRRSN